VETSRGKSANTSIETGLFYFNNEKVDEIIFFLIRIEDRKY
jgi:hypothetical protein